MENDTISRNASPGQHPSADLLERIRGLRSEAGQAGDRKMVEICDRALGGYGAELAECERVLAEAVSR